MALTALLGARPPASELRRAGTRVLRESLRESWFKVGALAVAVSVQACTGLLVPIAVGGAIDAAIHGTGLPVALGRLATLLVIGTLAMAADDLISAYFGSELTARLRHRLIARVLALGVPGQRRFPDGEMLARLTDNAAGPATFLPQLLSTAATLLTTVGAIVGLALIDPRLAITFLVGAPVAIPLLRWFVSRAGGSMQRYQQIQANLATRLLDAQRGARTIRAAGTVDRDIARVLEPVAELHERGQQLWSAQRRVSWQLSLLAPLLQIAVLAVGGVLLTAGDITAGQLIAASSYAGLAMGVIGLLDTVVALLTCQIGAGRVGEVLETSPQVTSPARPAALPDGQGRLEFHEVTVRMDDRTVLDHVDLALPPGTSVALVGRSGAGKTALTALIGRLLDPDSGTVSLDGVDVSTVELAELRRVVGYAFERPALLGTSVADLIGYGRDGASRASVEYAAHVAQADEFIRRLPEGYDTALPRAPLSGGELQRLGLAQAVHSDARVLVLDDATSSLDTATELRVTDALQHARAGRTCLVVAHRAGTAARADLVAWLENGWLRALAPHRELCANPEYRAVFAADALSELDERAAFPSSTGSTRKVRT